MAKAIEIADEFRTLTTNIEKEVGQYITLLNRNEASEGAAPSTQRKLAEEETKPVVHQQESERDQKPQQNKPWKPHRRPAQDENRHLVNVTTRLTSEINELLTEAALRQRLAKKKPDNRQAVIGEALRDWFRRNGYAGRG